MSVHRAKHRPLRAAPRGLAFYDLDGTLVDFNLVHAAIFIVTNLGEWTGRAAYLASLLARAPQLYRAEKFDRRLLNVVMFSGLRGVSCDRLRVLGEEYCERVLFDRIYTQARELLEGNRAAGLEPVLVTGSPDFIVGPLARKLGVADFAANRMVASRGIVTGRLMAPIMASTEKATWCASYAEARAVALADCWGYADSYYDLPFLAPLGHPVAVNPDERLAATALNRYWPIVHFTREKERLISYDNLMRIGNWFWGTADGASRG
ncbi:MAG TPA: HAD-IB family hydrolase [Candidatus Binataceae bacterium]|nr:HAD-IB family hydrolase [Candidatus Binataceae bacterium]